MNIAAAPLPVLAVTGLQAEARIAGGIGVATLSGGGDAARLAVLIQGSLAKGASAIISFGIAGGLAPGLPAGTVVIADRVESGEFCWDTDPQWRARLLEALPHAVRGSLAGVDEAVAGASSKTRLRGATGAVAVDMESHVAARLAALHGVPFAALRVIADPAERSLPQAALAGMRPDGSTDVRAVLSALLKRPGDVPALIHTALDARAAFAALASSRAKLSALFGFREPSSASAWAQAERDQEISEADALLALAESATDRA